MPLVAVFLWHKRADSDQSEHSLGGSKPMRAKPGYLSPQEQLHPGPGGQLGAALDPDGIKIFSVEYLQTIFS